jgi:hypothetical protein
VESNVIRKCQMEREAALIAQTRREQELMASVATTASSTAASISRQGAVSVNSGRNESSETGEVKSMQGADAAMLQLINGGSMLVPTPFASSAVAPGGNERHTVGSRSVVDLKDFESEQDPFENLSLRVMNDREELNQVFRMTATQPPAEVPIVPPPASSVLAGKPTLGTNVDTSGPVDGRSSALLQYVSGGASDNALTSGISFVPCQPITNQISDGMPVPVPGISYHIPQHPVAISSLPEPVSNVSRLPASGVSFLNNGEVSYAISSFTQPVVSPVSCTPLRTAKSTPDITSLDDKSAISLARRTPPPVKPTALHSPEVCLMNVHVYVI